jgi:hypothetical protein
MAAHNCNPSIWEDHAFKTNLSYTVRPCLKKKRKKRKETNRKENRIIGFTPHCTSSTLATSLAQTWSHISNQLSDSLFWPTLRNLKY